MYLLISGLVFICFVAEIREPWLRATLQEGFPDWVAAIFAFCGVVLFIANAPDGRLDREKIVAALSSLGLVSIAAATKPMYGLFAIAVFLGIGADACKCLEPASRNRFPGWRYGNPGVVRRAVRRLLCASDASEHAFLSCH